MKIPHTMAEGRMRSDMAGVEGRRAEGSGQRERACTRNF